MQIDNCTRFETVDLKRVLATVAEAHLDCWQIERLRVTVLPGHKRRNGDGSWGCARMGSIDPLASMKPFYPFARIWLYLAHRHTIDAWRVAQTFGHEIGHAVYGLTHREMRGAPRYHWAGCDSALDHRKYYQRLAGHLPPLVANGT